MNPRTQRLNDLLAFHQAAMEVATDVARSSRDHGPRHWRDVARIGRGLAKELGTFTEREADAVFMFAAVHDSQRQSEFSDPEHGARASEISWTLRMKGIGPDLGEDLARDLRFALELHDKGDVTDEKLPGCCWDSDRLTIGRVGIITDRAYMSTVPVMADFSGWLERANTIRLGDDMTWEEIAERFSRV